MVIIVIAASFRYGKESPGPAAYSGAPALGKQIMSVRESLPAWQLGTEKRFQYDFVKRGAAMPGPGNLHLIVCNKTLATMCSMQLGSVAQLTR